jgi:hypothetical protein
MRCELDKNNRRTHQAGAVSASMGAQGLTGEQVKSDVWMPEPGRYDSGLPGLLPKVMQDSRL